MKTVKTMKTVLLPQFLIINSSVFYQCFQTLENNGIHSTVHQAIFIVLLNLQNNQDNKNHCLSHFANSREQ